MLEVKCGVRTLSFSIYHSSGAGHANFIFGVVLMLYQRQYSRVVAWLFPVHRYTVSRDDNGGPPNFSQMYVHKCMCNTHTPKQLGSTYCPKSAKRFLAAPGVSRLILSKRHTHRIHGLLHAESGNLSCVEDVISQQSLLKLLMLCGALRDF